MVSAWSSEAFEDSLYESTVRFSHEVNKVSALDCRNPMVISELAGICRGLLSRSSWTTVPRIGEATTRLQLVGLSSSVVCIDDHVDKVERDPGDERREKVLRHHLVWQATAQQRTVLDS